MKKIFDDFCEIVMIIYTRQTILCFLHFKENIFLFQEHDLTSQIR